MKKKIIFLVVIISFYTTVIGIEKPHKGKVFWFEYKNISPITINELYALFKTNITEKIPLYSGKRGYVFLKESNLYFYDNKLRFKEALLLPNKPTTYTRDFDGKRIALGHLHNGKFIIKILDISMRKITDSFVIKKDIDFKIVGFFGRKIILENKKLRKLYYYSIFSQKLVLTTKNYLKLVGIGDYGSSIVFWDKEKILTFKRGKAQFKIKQADFRGGSSYNSVNALAYSSNGKIFLYDVVKQKVVGSINYKKGDFTIFSISQQGKRVFAKTKKGILVFDFYDKTHYTIGGVKPRKILMFESICDGEINTIYDGKLFYFLFLRDLSSPFALFKIYPSLSRNTTFYKKPKLRVWVHDRCLLSGARINPDVYVNGKVYKGKIVNPLLLKGENTVEVIVKDYAMNEKRIRTKIIYKPPIKVEILKIEKNPSYYDGKIVLLKGFAWGHNVRGEKIPQSYKKSKQLLKNSFIKKNSGFFSDGKYRVFMPVPPNEKGYYKIYAKIKVKKDKTWIILPLYVENYTP